MRHLHKLICCEHLCQARHILRPDGYSNGRALEIIADGLVTPTENLGQESLGHRGKRRLFSGRANP